MTSPVAPSIACTTLLGLTRYITPSRTSGVGWLLPGCIVSAQATRSRPTFSRVTWSSGLKPWPSSVRRQLSQSPGGGRRSAASVTGSNRSTRRLVNADGIPITSPADCASDGCPGPPAAAAAAGGGEPAPAAAALLGASPMTTSASAARGRPPAATPFAWRMYATRFR